VAIPWGALFSITFASLSVVVLQEWFRRAPEDFGGSAVLAQDKASGERMYL
jgi:hypothetical protein